MLGQRRRQVPNIGLTLKRQRIFICCRFFITTSLHFAAPYVENYSNRPNFLFIFHSNFVGWDIKSLETHPALAKISTCDELMCTYRLNWARRNSRRWWDEWDHTTLQTQNSKFLSRRSEVKHATSRSRRLPTILNLYKWPGEKHLLLWNARAADEPAISVFPSRQP